MATSYVYEQIQCYVAVKSLPDHVPLMRAFNGGNHIYTTNLTEYNSLPSSYVREGIACFISLTSLPGHTPLYRLYKRDGDDHFYTTSIVEKENAVSKYGYVKEGTIGYVQTAPVTDHYPLYRAFSETMFDHFYTTNLDEIDKDAPTLSAETLTQIVRTDLGPYLSPSCHFHIADSFYHAPAMTMAQKIIADAKVDHETWTYQKFDCDDFAHMLKAAFIKAAYTDTYRRFPMACGILWGDTPAPHALNFVVVGYSPVNMRLFIVEPQRGSFYLPAERKLEDIHLVIA